MFRLPFADARRSRRRWARHRADNQLEQLGERLPRPADPQVRSTTARSSRPPGSLRGGVAPRMSSRRYPAPASERTDSTAATRRSRCRTPGPSPPRDGAALSSTLHRPPRRTRDRAAGLEVGVRRGGSPRRAEPAGVAPRASVRAMRTKCGRELPQHGVGRPVLADGFINRGHRPAGHVAAPLRNHLIFLDVDTRPPPVPMCSRTIHITSIALPSPSSASAMTGTGTAFRRCSAGSGASRSSSPSPAWGGSPGARSRCRRRCEHGGKNFNVGEDSRAERVVDGRVRRTSCPTSRIQRSCEVAGASSCPPLPAPSGPSDG